MSAHRNERFGLLSLRPKSYVLLSLLSCWLGRDTVNISTYIPSNGATPPGALSL